MGFRVIRVLGFRALGFRVLGSRVWGVVFRVLGFRVEGSGLQRGSKGGTKVGGVFPRTVDELIP